MSYEERERKREKSVLLTLVSGPYEGPLECPLERVLDCVSVRRVHNNETNKVELILLCNTIK